MQPSVYDLKRFYTSRTGRVVRGILQQRINQTWNDTNGLRVMGCGYSAPYLRALMPNAERVISVMPSTMGAHHWPSASGEKNLTCLSDKTQLPIETNSIDRVLLVHDLEFCETIQPNLAEIWRVLKSSGRLLVIVPNRSGLWTRADWSPFGQGRPYSASQLSSLLEDNLFVHERTQEALFMPPLNMRAVLRLAGFFESIGNAIPIAAGVHIVEASKQIYARADKGHKAKAKLRVGTGLMPKPAMPFKN